MNCPAGQYKTGCDEASSGQCSNCPAGQYKTCPVGQTCPGLCVPCAKGQHQDDPGKGECKACDTGKYQDDAADTPKVDCKQCKVCAAGHYRTGCGDKDTCASGDCKDEGQCTQCLRGQYKSDANTFQTSYTWNGTARTSTHDQDEYTA